MDRRCLCAKKGGEESGAPFRRISLSPAVAPLATITIATITVTIAIVTLITIATLVGKNEPRFRPTAAFAKYVSE